MSEDAHLIDLEVTYPPASRCVLLKIDWSLCQAQGWETRDTDEGVFAGRDLWRPRRQLVIERLPGQARARTVTLPPAIFEALVTGWIAILRVDYRRRHHGDAGDVTLPLDSDDPFNRTDHNSTSGKVEQEP